MPASDRRHKEGGLRSGSLRTAGIYKPTEE